MPAFDVAGARKAGYDDKEILSYVAGEENPDLIPGTDAEKIRLLLARNGKHMLDVEYLSPTQLEPMQEVQFQDWAKRNKVRLEPGWNEDYDMRGLWKANPGAAPDPQGQWPDTYKLPNHPTFSSQSIYAFPELPAPKLPQGLSGPPASVPGSVPQTGERRNLTPQEQDALWSEQGIQPELTPPMSLKDLAAEPVMSLLGDADVSQYVLPAALLGMVRYKRPGVSAAAREAAEAYHGTPRVDPIGAKNTVFHATGPEKVEAILKAGEIVPDAALLNEWGLKKWEQARSMAAKAYQGAPLGVSVSRVPRVASKDSRAVSFVIDPEKMGASRPYVEHGYNKTLENAWEEYPGQLGDSAMNPHFEFEDRTYNTAIPRDAIREMWVDKSALPQGNWVHPNSPFAREESRALGDIRWLADQYGIPLRTFETGREMHSGRATLSSMVKKKKKRK